MSSIATDVLTCHQCGRELPARASATFRPEDAVCPACGTLQPPNPQLDHFQRLGVPRGVRLDAGELGRRFRELSRELHPDRFTGRSPRERRLALEHTTLLNDAQRVLRDPLKRVEYLLSTRGVVVEERSRGDEAFLMEVMELREEIEESLADRAAAEALLPRLQAEVDGCLATIDGILKAHPAPDPLDAAAAGRALGALIRLKYMASALADLSNRLERQTQG